MEQQKWRTKAVELPKRELSSAPSDGGVLTKGGKLGDEYQKRQAVALAKSAKRKVGVDGVPSQAKVDSQMANSEMLPRLAVSLGTFQKKSARALCTAKAAIATVFFSHTFLRTPTSSTWYTSSTW